MTAAEQVLAGRYRLQEQLASGGMGSVWRARDERLHRDVAVKRLTVQRGLSPQDAEIAAQRVMREARLTARLHHPNAVDVYDVVDDGGRPCLVMQYVPSTSLQQLVRDRGPLPVDTVRRIGAQVAAALAAAHRAGIVHRDVKPGNVLVDTEGTARITDFGISHAFDDLALTSTGLVTGTPAYLAPEVARGRPSTYASDVYSLGATLFMASTGSAPFGSDQNQMAMLHRVASAHSVPVLDGPLGALVGRMMMMAPGGRPAMVDIAPALLDTASPPAAEATLPVPVPGRLPPPAGLPMPVQVPPQVPAPMPPLGAPVAAGWPFLADEDDERPHRRRAATVVAALAAVVVVALGAALAAVLLGSGSSDSTGPSRSAVAGPPVTAGHGSSTATSGAATTDASLAAAVQQYYTTVPGDLGRAWSMLTPRYREGTGKGRHRYDKYWHQIDSVTLSGTQALPPNRVRTWLTYHFKNGRAATDLTEFTLVRDNGIWKIDGAQVLDR